MLLFWHVIYFLLSHDRKLRATRQRHILIHFCFSLLFLYVVFICGVDTANSTAGCVPVAALIHYFTLTTTMWMGVEARNLYSKLVTIFGDEKDWFMTAACIASWGKILDFETLVNLCVCEFYQTVC